jgi:hypothetical protein
MFMGDLANGHACDAFILAFADDIVTKFRSRLLDQTFGDKVRYYVVADTNWEVRLHAAVATGGGGEETFLLAGTPIFCPTSDDIIEQAAEALGLDDDEGRRRLEEAAQGETCPGWFITPNGDIEPCSACNPKGTAEQVYTQAAAWARGLSRHPRHQDHEECSLCCGFDAFECIGSQTQGNFAILRNHACGVFDDDGVAQDAARSLYSLRWTPCASRAGSVEDVAPLGERR